jgi:pyridoxine 5-phosphate synthase
VIRLSVNVNKIALLRNSRGTGKPDLWEFSKAALDAGAHGITVHPRPDERHIQYNDVRVLSGRLDGHELNVEGFPTPDFTDLVLSTKPAQVTLVPDDPNQLTSDHGWDVARQADFLIPVIQQFKENGIRVSLFMDPDGDMAHARHVGADRIELYTESFAKAVEAGLAEPTLSIFVEGAKSALEQGLDINAGHDLTLNNLALFCENIPGLLEVSIGHGLVIDALRMGWEETIQTYLTAMGHEPASE